jgi:hypothetical protein
MIHIRTDNERENSKSRFACGIGPEIPSGDVYFFESEGLRRVAAHLAVHGGEVCPGCFPGGKPELGTPISQVSGRPGHPGYAEFKRIADSWGYP